ncbi:hypothetical protein WJX73_000185 [Symbiochloris irregularis]|uniref:Uncharacterized protein n=1 Tax=Symbiochloris irregularis TaxID=706552 RepID=A0AAW1PA96_9CHLO
MEARNCANGKRYVLRTLEGSTGRHCPPGSACCCQDNVRARLLLEGHPEAFFTFNTVDLAAFESFVAAETVVRSIIEAGAYHFAEVEQIYRLGTGSIHDVIVAHQHQSRPPPAVLSPVPWMPDSPLINCVLAGNSLESHIVVAGIFGDAGCYLSFPRSNTAARPVGGHINPPMRGCAPLPKLFECEAQAGRQEAVCPHELGSVGHRQTSMLWLTGCALNGGLAWLVLGVYSNGGSIWPSVNLPCHQISSMPTWD